MSLIPVVVWLLFYTIKPQFIFTERMTIGKILEENDKDINKNRHIVYLLQLYEQLLTYPNIIEPTLESPDNDGIQHKTSRSRSPLRMKLRRHSPPLYYSLYTSFNSSPPLN